MIASTAPHAASVASTKLKVLYLAPLIPYPLTDGGRQRLHSVMKALLDEHDVYFAGLARATDDHSDWPIGRLLAAQPLVTIDKPSMESTKSRVGAVSGLKRWAQPSAFRRVEATQFGPSLQLLPLQQIDVVHVATTLVAPFAIALKQQFPHLQLVADLPDIAWHMRYRVATRVDGWWYRRSGLNAFVDTARWYSFEKAVVPHFSRIFVCSAVDRERLRGWVDLDRVCVAPNGTDVDAVAMSAIPASSSDLVFVGTMSYEPNEEGVLYFSKEVWPQIRQAMPEARFWIVGKDPSLRVQRLARGEDGIVVTGAVPDVRPFLERAAAVVVPLRSGGGTRLKILEAMAAGRPVVSTAIGIEGIEAKPGRHYLLADGPEELSHACVVLLRDREKARAMAAEGRALVEERYDWRVALRCLTECYAKLADARTGL